MTKEQAIEDLKALQEQKDRVLVHLQADQVLCNLLISLGHDEVVKEWGKVASMLSSYE